MTPTPAEDVQIPVELGGVTRFVDRSDVTHVEAHGDYARLHTAGRTHLIRVPLATLEEEWAGAGFVRIHRSLLVALRHVTEIRMEAGRCTVAVGPRDAATELVVSRRHTRELRELLRPASHVMTDDAARRPGSGSPARRGAGTPRRPGPATSTSRPRSATSTSAACSASSSRWPCGSSRCSSSPSARCRCCFASSPSWPRSTSSGLPLRLAAARGARLPLAAAARLSASSAAPSATSATSCCSSRSSTRTTTT